MTLFNNTNKIEKLFNLNLNKNQQKNLENVLKDFPGKLNKRVFELARKSDAILQQFVPLPIESESLDQKPIYKPRISPTKGVERGYLDRIIIMPTMTCESFCRYCFLRPYGFGSVMSNEDIDNIINYVKENKEIRYVIITGGDPMINIKRLKKVLKGLVNIKNLDAIRIGTRTTLYDPLKFNSEFLSLAAEVQASGKRFEIGAHMNHPDEMDSETEKCIEKLVKNNITVYSQTTLLKGINDNANILLELYRKLYHAGGEIYLLFHCDPINGISHLRTRISKGLELKEELADLTSARLIPKYKVAKCEIGVDSTVLEKGDDYIWIETPYTINNLKKIIPDYEPNFSIERISNKGKLIIKYDGKW